MQAVVIFLDEVNMESGENKIPAFIKNGQIFKCSRYEPNRKRISEKIADRQRCRACTRSAMAQMPGPKCGDMMK
jgi:hypothetical protein